MKRDQIILTILGILVLFPIITASNIDKENFDLEKFNLAAEKRHFYFIGLIFGLISTVTVLSIMKHSRKPKREPEPFKPEFDKVESQSDLNEFLSELEPSIRRLWNNEPHPEPVKKFFYALEKQFGFKPVFEKISEYDDELLERYELKEPMVNQKDIKIFQPWWEFKGKRIYKGSIIKAE